MTRPSAEVANGREPHPSHSTVSSASWRGWLRRSLCVLRSVDGGIVWGSCGRQYAPHTTGTPHRVSQSSPKCDNAEGGTGTLSPQPGESSSRKAGTSRCRNRSVWAHVSCPCHSDMDPCHSPHLLHRSEARSGVPQPGLSARNSSSPAYGVPRTTKGQTTPRNPRSQIGPVTPSGGSRITFLGSDEGSLQAVRNVLIRNLRSEDPHRLTRYFFEGIKATAARALLKMEGVRPSSSAAVLGERRAWGVSALPWRSNPIDGVAAVAGEHRRARR